MAVCADQQASRAAMVVADRGGNAVDMAIAANAAIAVTSPHLCGLGGDLFALVHDGRSVHALNASGRAGSLADPEALRAEGHVVMPFRHDPAAVTVPGCVDGWMALHTAFGSLELSTILEPAIDLAEHGFCASPLLVASIAELDDTGRVQLRELVEQAVRPGALMRRPGVARTLRAIAGGGRTAFYEGEFGAGLAAIPGSKITADDLARSQADWVEPVTANAFAVDLHTIGPNSQGYLALGGARVASTLDLPADPDDPRWAHLMVESAIVAGYDRHEVLHEHADGPALLAMIDARALSVDTERASGRAVGSAAGDTTYLCTADGSGRAVSLIQSNASGFGSWLVESSTGINLHNRGLGFNLVPGHPAEYGPGRRPPHTLSPALATDADGLRAVLGTMGGDAQPQILLQVAGRLFGHGDNVADAIAAPRWVLRGPATGFDTWADGRPTRLGIEGHAPDTWDRGLTDRGYQVRRTASYISDFGHAHAIVRTPNGWAGAADPRAVVGAAIGH